MFRYLIIFLNIIIQIIDILNVSMSIPAPSPQFPETRK